MSGEAAFQAFCDTYGSGVGDDVMERIAETLWCGSGELHGIKVRDIHQHNACNHTISGEFEHEGERWAFIVQMGDWVGCSIAEFGLADDVGIYEAPIPTLYTFVPQDDLLKENRPKMYEIYLAWTRTDWFKEKVQAYNYDRHFQPGGKTEAYYRDWAAKKGMKPAVMEDKQP